MTSGFKVWWQLTKERGRQAIQLLWVDLGVVAVLVVMRLLGRLTAADLLGFSIMFGMLTALVAFIAEAQGQEQVWVTNAGGWCRSRSGNYPAPVCWPTRQRHWGCGRF